MGGGDVWERAGYVKWMVGGGGGGREDEWRREGMSVEGGREGVDG